MMKKGLALLLAICLVVLCAACSADTKSKGKDKDGEATEPNANAGEPSNDNDGGASLPAAEGVKKLCDIDGGYTMALGGIIYSETTGSTIYGVKTFDGSYESGLVFDTCQAVGPHFIVRMSKPSQADEFDKINTVGVIDGRGNTVVPAEYAAVAPIPGSTRFVTAVKAQAITQDPYNTAIRLTPWSFEGNAVSENVLYSGTIVAYDLQTGKQVPNVSGTKEDDFLVTRANNYCIDHRGNTYNAEGQATKWTFDNGTYYDDGAKAICNAAGDKKCNWPDGYEAPTVMVGDCYLTKLIETQEPALVDAIGTPVCECVGATAIEALDGYYLAKFADEYAVLNRDGLEIYRGKNVQSDGSLVKMDGGEPRFYSFVDKDYTLKGGRVAQWLIKTQRGDTYDLVDVRTNKTVASGHTDYTVLKDDNGDVIVIDGQILIKGDGDNAACYSYPYIQ